MAQNYAYFSDFGVFFAFSCKLPDNFTSVCIGTYLDVFPFVFITKNLHTRDVQMCWLAAAAAPSYLPAGRLEVDGASSVGHGAFHPHEEISLGAQLFAFFTEAAA